MRTTMSLSRSADMTISGNICLTGSVKMLYETFRNGISYEALEWLDAVVKYKEDLENFVYDDPEAYKVFPMENYKQASVDIEAGRAAVQAKLEKKLLLIHVHLHRQQDRCRKLRPHQSRRPSQNRYLQLSLQTVTKCLRHLESLSLRRKFSPNAPTGKYVPKDQVPVRKRKWKREKSSLDCSDTFPILCI